MSTLQLKLFDVSVKFVIFHKVAPHYYTRWHEPATELHKKYNKLSDKNKEIRKVTMRLAAYDMNATAWS